MNLMYWVVFNLESICLMIKIRKIWFYVYEKQYYDFRQIFVYKFTVLMIHFYWILIIFKINWLINKSNEFSITWFEAYLFDENISKLWL